MDNPTMARLLAETADLLEIDGGDSFRIRSYRRAAEVAKQTTMDLVAAAPDTARLLTLPESAKVWPLNIQAIANTGTLSLARRTVRPIRRRHARTAEAARHGPKNSRVSVGRCQIASVDQLAAAIDAGASPACPAWARSRSRSCARASRTTAAAPAASASTWPKRQPRRIAAYLLEFEGIEKVTPAGSLRRGRETVGDLDLLATGPACAPEHTAAAVEHVAAYPGIHDIIAKGENKVSFHLEQGMQVDVRLLPSASYGAALQYFTGSKAHNVALRQRALKMGYTLSEWALARLDDGSTVAAATEEEIYAALGMDWIPPEIRENLGEIEAAASHALPQLIEQADIQGDLHMHTNASDGHNTIREMADAALACGYKYIAITDHSKNLAMTNGLDEKRALEHIKHIHEVDKKMEGRIRVFAGIEVDILADGALDLDDEVLAQMEIVIASVHSRFDQPRDEITARVIRAIENPYVRILGHPTGRLLLRREPFAMDMGVVLRRAAELGVAVEHNAAPERLDLNERDLRLAKELGCSIVINSDSHDVRNLGKMDYGVLQLRRAWLGPKDLLNTQGAKKFLTSLRPRP